MIWIVSASGCDDEVTNDITTPDDGATHHIQVDNTNALYIIDEF